MEKSNFDKLLERYLDGKVSPVEKLKIESWLDSRKTREEKLRQWSPEEEEQLFQKITDSIHGVGRPVARPVAAPVRSSFHIAWKIAAVIIFLMGVTASILYYTQSSQAPEAEITTLDHPMKVILSDGTIVWLRPDSKLVYFRDKQTGNRKAELRGEGLFEVAKDAKHPMIIRCGEVNVRVVGTSFNLKANVHGVELNVLTGRVNVSRLAEKDGIMVEPNERIHIPAAGGDLFKTELKPEETYALISKTEYNMHFSNTPMDTVVQRIGRKFNVHLSIGNHEMAKCRISADFTDQSLEHTLQMLSELLELSYTINGNSVAITGRGCN